MLCWGDLELHRSAAYARRAQGQSKWRVQRGIQRCMCSSIEYQYSKQVLLFLKTVLDTLTKKLYLFFRHNTLLRKCMAFKHPRWNCLKTWRNLLWMTWSVAKMVRDSIMELSIFFDVYFYSFFCCHTNQWAKCTFNIQMVLIFRWRNIMYFNLWYFLCSRAAIYIRSYRKWQNLHDDWLPRPGGSFAPVPWHDLQQYRPLPGKTICKALNNNFILV